MCDSFVLDLYYIQQLIYLEYHFWTFSLPIDIYNFIIFNLKMYATLYLMDATVYCGWACGPQERQLSGYNFFVVKKEFESNPT